MRDKATMRAILCVLPVLVMTAGCWQPRYFSPREHRDGLSPSGDVAAAYEVRAGEGEASRGELRVWSEGARAQWDDSDEEVVALHVGFELENNGSSPLELDTEGLRCEELYVDGLLQAALAPTTVRGDGRALPGTTTRVDVVFTPPTSRPRHVDGFAVRFAVRDESGAIVQQSTPFAPERHRAGYGNTYSYWGWGVGPWEPYGPWYWSVGYRPWGFGPGCYRYWP